MIHNLTNSINFKTSSLKLQDFCHFDDATLVAIIEYTIGRRVMSSFQVHVMVYVVSWDVSSLSLHHFDFDLHTNYLFLGLCKYISSWTFAYESILILCAFLKNWSLRMCLEFPFHCKTKNQLIFTPNIFLPHYVIWFQELQQRWMWS